MLNRFVNPHRLDYAVSVIDQNLGFWVGNISLGYFLGSMGAIGKIFGLPLDIRHISFSSVYLGNAIASLDFHVPLGLVALAIFSVLLIGLVNLAVSFSLSLFVAIKSRRIRFSQTRELMRLLLKRLMTKPKEYFIPPPEPAT